MIKINARIASDVEYIVDAKAHDDAKRVLLETLHIDGYKNVKLTHITTEKLDTDKDLDIDLSYKAPSYMWGKI